VQGWGIVAARLYGKGGRYALLARGEAQVGTGPLRPADREEALRMLRQSLTGSMAMADLRQWAAQGGLPRPGDAAVMRHLADRVVSGDLRLQRLDAVWNEAAATPVTPPPAPVPPGPGPKPKPAPVTELVVTVKTLDGKPVDKCRVTAGALGSRFTGTDGVADFGTVAPGTYDVTAEKDGHGKTRNGPVVKDEKKAVAVPQGSRTAVSLIQHPDCANVAFFEGPTAREKYFGFDHKTNIRPAGGKSYWDPVPEKGSLTLPGDKLTRDEARWVSVAVGQEIELEINFAFKDAECIPCIANCTFQVVPGNVAEVLTSQVSAKKAVFRIKGKAKGEASLKVVCDGKDIGWFHIWCDVAKELLVDVACIVTTRTSLVVYDLAGLQTYMNEIFRQMLISLNLKDLGTIDLSGNAALAAVEAQSYPAGKKYQEGTTEDSDKEVLTALDDAAMASVAARVTGPTARAGARRLYWYVPDVGAEWGGMNLEIGHPATFIFFGESVAARNTGAHEIGHSLRLRHPLHDDGAGQFCAHNLATLNQPSPAYPATNTEPASGVVGAKPNVMANDPTNLMGYWPFKAARKYLRYHQWIATDRS
jgi:hypothetical protein